ncbi:MAG: hypothetical protein IH940_06120 [Acidobacteria bacterium]|nr:hypothetical protein [Acidobacteriota bacterium]
MADDPTPQEGARRLTRMNDWRRDLSEQIAGLPKSIAELRTTVRDLRKVVERLEIATETLEQANRIYESSGAMEAARAMTDATVRVNEAAREIARNAPGRDLLDAGISDLQKLLSRLRPSDAEPDDSDAGAGEG